MFNKKKNQNPEGLLLPIANLRAMKPPGSPKYNIYQAAVLGDKGTAAQTTHWNHSHWACSSIAPEKVQKQSPGTGETSPNFSANDVSASLGLSHSEPALIQYALDGNCPHLSQKCQPAKGWFMCTPTNYFLTYKWWAHMYHKKIARLANMQLMFTGMLIFLSRSDVSSDTKWEWSHKERS